MDYSISIGIENYLELKETKYACADAEEFDRIMKEVFCVSERTLLLNSNATILNIQKAVESIFEKMQEGDRLLFYFAGHGVSFYNEPRLSCYDSKKNVLPNIMTWYNIYELMKKQSKPKLML